MTHTFRPDLEILEEKIQELEHQVADSPGWIQRWEAGKKQAIERAVAEVEKVRVHYNEMLKQHEAHIKDSGERLAVLKDALAKLKANP